MPRTKQKKSLSKKVRSVFKHSKKEKEIEAVELPREPNPTPLPVPEKPQAPVQEQEKENRPSVMPASVTLGNWRKDRNLRRKGQL